MAKKKFRVLLAGIIGGIPYLPNDVVEMDETIAKPNADKLDATPEAVAYALSENGGKVKAHPTPAAPVKPASSTKKKEGTGADTAGDSTATPQDLAAQIAALESQLAQAPDDAKADLEEALAAAKAAQEAAGTPKG